jgi:Dolichyl-phosphate-mannose-protein mannosyltransferase
MQTPVMTRTRRIAVYAAAAAITIYGALLRLDAFVGKYGPLDRPAWARAMTHQAAAVAREIRPQRVSWTKERTPYVGGDPIGYLNFAREMTTFYQPHFREPVFLAATRVALWMLNGQDSAVSLASAAGSILMIVGIFLLGSEVVGPAAGLAAALIVAVDYDLIAWSVDGWRDDMFSAFVLLSTWMLVRLHRRPSFWNAVATGVICGLTCLTRITALSFIVPALGWIAWTRDRQLRRARLESATLAAVLAAAVLGPFLLSCAIAFGDPFLAIDQHTIYYRAAEGLKLDQHVGAGGYVLQKFRGHPIATLDTAITGEFVRPFAIKWNGLGVWSSWMGTALAWLSLLGLSAFAFWSTGRLLLLVTVASLLPYAFTWNVGAGGEWRFTMHTYGLYIVAAMYAVALMPRLRERQLLPLVARRSFATGALAAAAAAVYLALPWFVVREAIALNESVSIQAGERDRVFFRSGWLPPRAEGTVTTRTSRQSRATVHLPLPSAGDYDVVFRADPIEPKPVSSAMVLFNGQIAGGFGFVTSPDRIGSYRLTLPRVWQKAGDNELTLTTTGAAGVRVWLVRIIPMRVANGEIRR